MHEYLFLEKRRVLTPIPQELWRDLMPTFKIPTGFEREDIKLPMGPYCRQVQSILLFHISLTAQLADQDALSSLV
jgi:hypothetical protein